MVHGLRTARPSCRRVLAASIAVVALGVTGVLSSATGAGAAVAGSASDGLAADSAVPAVRLQIVSFRSPERAAQFVANHQLGWNECVLGKQLGVLPPGRSELPEVCTAQTDVEVLEVRSAALGGRPIHRVTTRAIPIDQLWGPLTAYRQAGFEPLIVK
jgi:hypothetical protein